MMEVLNYTKPILEAFLYTGQIQQTAKTNPYFADSMCDCKKLMLNIYLTGYNNLITNIASAMMRVTPDRVDKLVKTCKEVFIYHTYEQMRMEPFISSKMVLLFERVQRPIEMAIWEKLEAHLSEFAGLRNGRKYEVFCCTLGTLMKWADLALLSLNGLRINCADLKNSILGAGEISTARCEYSQACCKHEHIVENQALHLMLTPESIESPYWCTQVMMLIQQFHRRPDQVTLIIDAKLIDDMELPDYITVDCVVKAKSIFKDLQVINVSDKCKETVDKLLEGKLEVACGI
jgi:hypothetical protein